MLLDKIMMFLVVSLRNLRLLQLGKGLGISLHLIQCFLVVALLFTCGPHNEIAVHEGKLNTKKLTICNINMLTGQ